MSYGYIENLEEGTVTRIGPLPQSWKCYSNHFPEMSIECINSCGWYEIEEIAADPTDYQTYTKEYKLDEDDIIRPVYTYTDLSLEDYKIKRTNYIKSEYDATLFLGFDTSLGFKIDCQKEDIRNFAAEYLGMGIDGDTTTIICDFNNEVHSITKSQYETMCSELRAYVKPLWNRKWTKRLQIDNSTTLIQISGVEW